MLAHDSKEQHVYAQMRTQMTQKQNGRMAPPPGRFVTTEAERFSAKIPPPHYLAGAHKHDSAHSPNRTYSNLVHR